MNLPRRDFLKTTLAASASAAFASRLSAADATAPAAGRDYYDLRCYHLMKGTRLPADADPALLDAYLEQALLPALGRRGIGAVGVFTELDVNKEAATATPKPGSPVWVLIRHASLESFAAVSGDLNADPAVQAAGHAYLQTDKAHPAFERIDSWLLRAFKGLPQLNIPAFSRDRVATRVFELRDYESYSEAKALSKMAMFDDGEVDLMKDLGMSPLFFGQALAGPNLPHLRYITCGPDLATHLGNWKKFGADPRWTKIKDLPQYADNVSKNTPRFLAPKPYSQL